MKVQLLNSTVYISVWMNSLNKENKISYHSGIVLTPEKMTTTNKVKAMASGDIIIHILVHAAVLIIQVRVYVTLKFFSSNFDVRNIIPCTDKIQWPGYKQVSVCHKRVVRA